MNVTAVSAGILLLSLAALPVAGRANPARDAIVSQLANQAKAANPAFAGFSAERGKAFYGAKHTGGKPDQPSCATCHTVSPRQTGKTRAGKEIAPLAVSVTPDRFTDGEKVDLWFKRNCTAVLGRECTPLEKGDFLAFAISQ
jgi:hypothetical protein